MRSRLEKNAKRGRAEQIERHAIDRDRADPGDRRHARRQACRIDDREPLRGREPDASVGTLGSASVRAACFQRCAARRPSRIRGYRLHRAVRSARDRAPPAGGGSRSPPTAIPCCPRPARRSDRAGRLEECWASRGPRRSARGPPPCPPTATRRLAPPSRQLMAPDGRPSATPYVRHRPPAKALRPCGVASHTVPSPVSAIELTMFEASPFAAV